MGERTPLLHYRLAASGHEDSGEHRTREESAERRAVRRRSAHGQPQKLSTFFGVVIPTLLSMFSVVVFLRIGECVRVCVCGNVHGKNKTFCYCRCREVCNCFTTVRVLLRRYVIVIKFLVVTGRTCVLLA